MWQVMSWIMDALMLVAEWLIVVMLLDDIYSLSQLKRKSKRMMRRNWKKFLTQTRRYFRVKEKILSD